MQEEEREVKAADTTKIQTAMAALVAQKTAALEAQKQKDKELAAVKVNQEDIDVIATEFELDRKTAERRLREAKGDVKMALETLIEN